MTEGSSNEQRICFTDILPLDFPVIFQGKTQVNKVLKTCHGEFLVPATQVSMLLTGADETAAFDHFRNVSKRIDSLQHNGEKLQDHIQVLNFEGLSDCV